jgi:hypothetical protein
MEAKGVAIAQLNPTSGNFTATTCSPSVENIKIYSKKMMMCRRMDCWIYSLITYTRYILTNGSINYIPLTCMEWIKN